MTATLIRPEAAVRRSPSFAERTEGSLLQRKFRSVVGIIESVVLPPLREIASGDHVVSALHLLERGTWVEQQHAALVDQLSHDLFGTALRDASGEIRALIADQIRQRDAERRLAASSN